MEDENIEHETKEVLIKPIHLVPINSETEKLPYKIKIPYFIDQFVTISEHKHPLRIQEYRISDPIVYYCNICHIFLYQIGYRCSEGCDYDCCINCVTKEECGLYYCKYTEKYFYLPNKEAESDPEPGS